MNTERVIHLRPGHTALFGYGSLLSLPSLEKTLGRPYTGPLLSSRLGGWRRTWDAALPNTTVYAETPQGRMYPKLILYLNVRRRSGSMTNGIVFVVDAAALAAYDRREWVYERVNVTDDLDVRIEGGQAFAYVCRAEYCHAAGRRRTEAAVRASYVKIVESGLATLGANFRKEYARWSDPLPKHLVITDLVEHT